MVELQSSSSRERPQLWSPELEEESLDFGLWAATVLAGFASGSTTSESLGLPQPPQPAVEAKMDEENFLFLRIGII